MGTPNMPESGANTTAGNTQGTNPNGGSDAGRNTGTATNGGNAEGVADMARNFASQAQQKAGEQVRSTVDKGRTRAADTLQQVARTLMQQDEQGEDGEQGDNVAAPYMHRAGEQVQRFADYLQNADPRQMMTGAEQFARRQPVLFLGGAFALGILAARFLKSTPERGGYGDGYANDGYGSNGYGSNDRTYDRERSLSSYREPGYAAGRAAEDGVNRGIGGMSGMSGTGTQEG